jgi:hypothetical protein
VLLVCDFLRKGTISPAILTQSTSGSIALSYAAHSQLCINQLMLNGNDPT